MKKVLIIFILIIGITLISGCTEPNKPENAIIGQWNEIGGTETIEFFKDGTITIVDSDVTFVGDYKFIDETTMRMELGGIGALVGPIVVNVAVSKDELFLSLQNEEANRYKRVR